MSLQIQEIIALSVVGFVVLSGLKKIILSLFGASIVRFLLNRGKVKWAMRLHGKTRTGLT